MPFLTIFQFQGNGGVTLLHKGKLFLEISGVIIQVVCNTVVMDRLNIGLGGI
ncbi:hypothetical protein D3C72_1129240 [compost metagenome]